MPNILNAHIIQRNLTREIEFIKYVLFAGALPFNKPVIPSSKVKFNNKMSNLFLRILFDDPNTMETIEKLTTGRLHALSMRETIDQHTFDTVMMLVIGNEIKNNEKLLQEFIAPRKKRLIKALGTLYQALYEMPMPKILKNFIGKFWKNATLAMLGDIEKHNQKKKISYVDNYFCKYLLLAFKRRSGKNYFHYWLKDKLVTYQLTLKKFYEAYPQLMRKREEAKTRVDALSYKMDKMRSIYEKNTAPIIFHRENFITIFYVALFVALTFEVMGYAANWSLESIGAMIFSSTFPLSILVIERTAPRYFSNVLQQECMHEMKETSGFKDKTSRDNTIYAMLARRYWKTYDIKWDVAEMRRMINNYRNLYNSKFGSEKSSEIQPPVTFKASVPCATEQEIMMPYVDLYKLHKEHHRKKADMVTETALSPRNVTSTASIQKTLTLPPALKEEGSVVKKESSMRFYCWGDEEKFEVADTVKKLEKYDHAAGILEAGFGPAHQAFNIVKHMHSEVDTLILRSGLRVDFMQDRSKTVIINDGDHTYQLPCMVPVKRRYK